MLRNRQEGIINLHGLWATAALAFVFLIQKWAFELSGWTFVIDHMDLYLVGAVVGSLFNQRLYRSYINEFANLNWGQTFFLTYNQTLRIALVLFAIHFALKDVGLSRVFLSSYLCTCFLTLYGVNKLLPKQLCKLSFHTQVIPTLIIGSTKSLDSLKGWIKDKSDFGIEIIGYVAEGDPDKPKRKLDVPCLGSIENLASVLEKQEIAQVVIMQNSLSREATVEAMNASQKVGCRIRIYNNWQEQYNHRILVEHEGRHTFLTLEDEPLENPINRVIKRSFDIGISLPIVAFVLPILTLVVWFFQRKQSPGPIFYTQPRTGMTKRTFHIIKYRTMHTSDDNVLRTAQQATKDDDRIYAFGSLLRKSSMDELPQFINVLLGDMSVAGPRPHLIDHDKQFSQLLQAYYTRHFVKPGITGLAQSKGYRGEIQQIDLLKKRISYDIFYINNWSLLLDVKIVLITVKSVIFPPKTAY